MDAVLDLQKRLIPDLLPIMLKRYEILRIIKWMEPVGRRSLANQLEMTERILRSEVEFLKEQGLITIKNMGMAITEEGRKLLEQLEPFVRKTKGMDVLEQKLQHIFSIQKVIIVAGNSETTPLIKKELGRACVHSMKEHLQGENIIAVTGGSTMAAVAEMLTPDLQDRKLQFVPARGGIGEDMKNQANTICAKMAEKTMGTYRTLYVPDQVSKEIYDSLVKEPQIHEVLELIKSASMVLHGIGEATTMAIRRKTNEIELEKITEKHAVGEAFGYYFNELGQIVHQVQTIGLQLEQVQQAETVIAVAGGATKAKAIVSYMKQAPTSTILILDEGAALEIASHYGQGYFEGKED